MPTRSSRRISGHSDYKDYIARDQKSIKRLDSPSFKQREGPLEEDLISIMTAENEIGVTIKKSK